MSVSLQWLHANPSRRACAGSWFVLHPVRSPAPFSSSAHVPFLSVRSASRSVARFGNARVTIEDILRLDSGKSVPGMPSRHGRITLFTDEFWNVRHIHTTADSKGRAGVVARVATLGIASFTPVCLTPAGKRTTVREVFLQVRREPGAPAPPESVGFPVVVLLAGGSKTRLSRA
ncbi:MAG: hypothetical protein OXU75_13690 [Deltaproteobacteria bacterium]|nr:hypothetical protein [Deltaproteobacteria bacterium]